MGDNEAKTDPLSRWLSGEGLAALNGITGSAQDVVGVMDRDLTVRYLNWTVPGLALEKVLGRNVLELVPPGYQDIARDTYQGVLRTGQATQFETIYRDGGHLRIWDVHVSPIRFEGEVVGLHVNTSEVTAQRRAYADRDRFFSLSLDLLLVASPEGRMKRLNPLFGEILGYDVADLIDRPFIELVHADDRARTLESYALVLGGVAVGDFENRYRRRDGEYRVFSWRATIDPVTRDVYAVARDVTEHRVTEAQLRHAQKMEAVGQLAGGVAHDFNNLLLAILGNTELASQDGVTPAELGECLAEIKSAAHRAADLTKQLLTFSRRQPLRPVPIDLNVSIRGLMKMLRRLLPESIGVDFVPGQKLTSASVDPSQLEQVIVNLCLNARDAMEHGGELTLQTEDVVVDGRYIEAHPWAKPGHYVLLSVTDTGAGMTPEVRERAFEPFFTTKGPQHGTGLGLSTVYGIVQQHGGMIHLHSEPDVGTTFKIYLPADSRLAEDVSHKVESVPPSGTETILLAEDEERVRRAVVQMLERAGYHTLAAANGVEALRLLRELTEPVDLLLLDVVMPEQGGPETWEQAQSLRPGLRVLFTSGYADDRYRKLLPPDADVLEKPYPAEELLRRIRKSLDKKSG